LGLTPGSAGAESASPAGMLRALAIDAQGHEPPG